MRTRHTISYCFNWIVCPIYHGRNGKQFPVRRSGLRGGVHAKPSNAVWCQSSIGKGVKWIANIMRSGLVVAPALARGRRNGPPPHSFQLGAQYFRHSIADVHASRHRWNSADPWHDGAVSDAQIAHAVDTEFGIDHGFVILAHAAGTG
jgi:hypothetical protein